MREPRLSDKSHMARILYLLTGISIVMASCANLHSISSQRPAQTLPQLEAVSIVHQTLEPKVVTMAQTFEQNGLLLTISKVAIEPHAISVELTIHNQTGQILRFYPDQGTVLTGSTVLPANIFLSGAHLSGAFEPGERQSGMMVFSTVQKELLDPAQIQAVQLTFGRVLDMQTINSQDVRIAIALNQA